MDFPNYLRSNPVIALAERLSESQYSEAEAEAAFRAMLAAGISAVQIKEALALVLNPAIGAPVPLISGTAWIIATLAANTEQTELAAQVHLKVANYLDERLEDPRVMVSSLMAAVEHYEAARAAMPALGEPAGVAAMQQANAITRLAELGVEQIAGLRRAVDLHELARGRFVSGSRNAGICGLNEATARARLAELGEEPERNLQRAVALYEGVRDQSAEGSLLMGRCRFNQANTLAKLAGLGVKPEAHLRSAVALYQTARSSFAEGSVDAGLCQMNEATAWQRLAELGAEPAPNLRRAIELHVTARESFTEGSPHAGGSRLNEANVWRILAGLGVEPESSLRRAIKLYEDARICFSEGSPDVGICLVNEAVAWQCLGQMGLDPEANLRRALLLLEESRGFLHEDSPAAGNQRMTEANIRASLAGFGVEPRMNLQRSLELHEAADSCFAPLTVEWGANRCNWGLAFRILAGEDAANELAHLRSARALLETGLKVTEATGATFGSEESRRNFRETTFERYRAMVEVSIMIGEKEPNAEQAEAIRWEAWHWCHRSKSRALLDTLGSARPRLDKPEDLALWEQWEAARTELDRRERAVRAQMNELDPDELRALREAYTGGGTPRGLLGAMLVARDKAHAGEAAARQAVTERIEGAAELINFEVPSGREVGRQLRDLNGAQSGASRRRTLMVEFFQIDGGRLALFLAPLWENAAPVIEIIALSEGALEEAVAGLRDAHERLCGRPRAMRHAGEGRQAPAEEREAWHLRSAKAIEALEPLAAGIMKYARKERWAADELVICPHILLNLLPVWAAPWEGKPLIAHLPVSSFPSAALALEMLRAPQMPAGRAALVLGDPRGDLPGARAEAQEVGWLLREAGLEGAPLIGQEALTGGARAGAESARVIHAALHSMLDHQEFLNSGLELFDRRLTAMDILQLDLRATTLVFLSSCDSGQSIVGRTDDLMALARTFFLAGAPSVVATLWELDDGAGSYFAPRFHNHWLKGMSLAEAYRNAMLETREEYPQPFYWAPFVLMGAWHATWQKRPEKE